MKTIDDVIRFILHGGEQYLHNLTIDCAILGYHDQQLKILLIKQHNQDGWILPGGFIQKEEKFSEAANRILEERTGLKGLFLQQFHTFGDSPYRVKKFTREELQQQVGSWLNITADNWLIGRPISIGYYALVDYKEVKVQMDLLVETYQWCDISEVPHLLHDHTDMLNKALETIRLHLYHQPIGKHLLPEKFSLPEIHILYETLLGKPLDRRNFPRKLFALGLLNKLDEQRPLGTQRTTNLYEFNTENYQKALDEGIVLVI